MTSEPMFIRGRVAINEFGPIDEKDITDEMNVIFIRPKMDFGTSQKVIGAAAKMIDQGKLKNPSARNMRRQQKRGKADFQPSFDLGAYNVALMVNNILGWQGPEFISVYCNEENISALNQSQPLVSRVLKEINDRNVTKQDETDDDDENEANEDGSPNVIDLTTYSQNTAT